MPRTTNVKAMRAIVIHNVIKQMKRLTKENKEEIKDFVNSLSLEELKQKGLTKQIISQFKNRKPRKTLTGGMKRGNEYESSQPKKRSFIGKLTGLFKGEHFNDDKYTIENSKKELSKINEEEKQAEEKYKYAQRQTEQALRNEEIARREYTLRRAEKMEIIERHRNYFVTNSKLAETMENEHAKNLELLDYYDKMIADNLNVTLNNRARQTLVSKMLDNDGLYFNSTHRHLPQAERFIQDPEQPHQPPQQPHQPPQQPQPPPQQPPQPPPNLFLQLPPPPLPPPPPPPPSPPRLSK